MKFINENEKPTITYEGGSVKPTHIIVKFKGYERKRRLKYGRDYDKLKTTEKKMQRIAQTIHDTKTDLLNSIEDDYASMKRESVAPVLQEYIVKNTTEAFDQTPFGQIVVDEINKAVAEIPEIKLALDYLSEQDDPELEANTKKLGREYATAALNKARTEMVEKLPGLVAELIDELITQAEAPE
tara:strand:+ start:291 stop:842 length:552 start_codon:yes stop_codon:yes gene_type:complete